MLLIPITVGAFATFIVLLSFLLFAGVLEHHVIPYIEKRFDVITFSVTIVALSVASFVVLREVV